MAAQNGIESIALPPVSTPVPSGSQDFNKALSSQVEYNSHSLSRWGANSEAQHIPGNPMSVVETVVADVYHPNLNPGLAGQAAPGSQLDSAAWDKCPI